MTAFAGPPQRLHSIRIIEIHAYHFSDCLRTVAFLMKASFRFGYSDPATKDDKAWWAPSTTQ